MRRLTLVLSLVAALALVPAAEAKRFGASLKRPANSKLTCSSLPGLGAFGEQIFYPTNARSCTWFTIARRYNTAKEGTIIPSNRGVVTSARLKVGRKTGRMRIVLLKAVAERPPGGYHSNQACCAQVKRTRVFRPRRGHITKKRLNWHLHGVSSFDPSTGLTTTGYYVLAVTVLSPNVPIPAQDTHRYDTLQGPGSTAFFPALKRREERAGGAGTFGYEVLLQGNWRR
jgi:hypothetical protein